MNIEPAHRKLTMKERKSTFPFDVLSLTLDCRGWDCEHISVVRDTTMTAQEQSEHIASMWDMLARGDVRVNAGVELVERHTCAYDTCANCGLETFADAMIHDEQYDTPWDDKPSVIAYCSGWCLEVHSTGRIYSGDFNYFDCGGCGRKICEQNPRNGWHVQYRENNGEQICLKCYEEHLMKYGLSLEELKSNGGMFHNEDELKEHGWACQQSYFLPRDMAAYHRAGEDALNRGVKIICNYERMAIGGLEGTVSLWIKEA